MNSIYTDIKQLRVLIENHFQLINQRLNEYDRNMEKVLKKLNKKDDYLTYDQISESVNIKVHSYLDKEVIREKK